jgi:CubicO group peptidase (beta-lactamase class C family)
MTHYLTAEMNGGVYNGTSVLPAQAMQETHAPLAPVDGQPPVPGATSYGLGWGVGTVNGTPVIVHDGQLRDFDTAAAILPEGKTAVVLLMNQDSQLVVNDDSLYNGLMQGITTGRFPAVSHSFVIFYAVLDVLVLATLVLMIASFWRAGRWLRKFRVRASRTGTMRAAVRDVGLDLVTAAAIAAAVVFGLGAVTGYVP